MIYRKLDANGDYVIGGNKACFYSGLEAVEQAISTRLKLMFTEWWEDLEDGLPFWQKIINQRDKETAKKEIEKRIRHTRHVRSVSNFTAIWDNENRILTINCDVDTDYGMIKVGEVFR